MSIERKITTSYGSGRKFKTAKEAMEHVTPFVGKVIDQSILAVHCTSTALLDVKLAQAR
jgi:hypothetical protein